jgi:hypothetical protein
MMKSFYALVTLLVLLGAWVRPARAEQPVSVSDVVSKPDDFNGKVIWASQADYEQRNWKQCISLLDFFADESRNKALDRTTVLITGKFSRDIFHDEKGQEVVRLGTCNQFGIRFTEPDALRKFSD